MGRLYRDATALLTVLLISVLEQYPVVIIFIPIVQGIAQRFDVPASKLLMPLSLMPWLGA